MASSENLLWMQNPQLANAMRRRQEGAALMRQGTDASPIQSPWQGVSRLAQALLGGYEARKGDEAISEAGEKRAKALADIMGGGTTPPPAAVGAALSGVAQPVQAQPLPAAGTGVDDEDLLVRTVYGEARGESPEGQRAVAAVVRNRAAASGKPLRDVVFAPNQFEPWNNPQTRAQLEALDPNSPEYQTILANLRTGQGDPTGGATHFYSPTAQTALGRQPPAWAQGDGKDIGRHRFYNLPYGGGGGAPGMATPAAAPGAQDGGQPPPASAPGGPGTPQFHMDRAQRLQAAGFQQEAQMEMQRAQMAQQAALARAPQPKNPIQVVDPNDPTGKRRIWIDPDQARGMQAPGPEPGVTVNTGENYATRKAIDDWGTAKAAAADTARRTTLFDTALSVLDNKAFSPGATAEIRLQGARLLQDLGLPTNAPAGEVLKAVQRQLELANTPRGQGQITENERVLIREMLPVLSASEEGLRMLIEATKVLDARDQEVFRIYNDSARKNGGVPSMLEVNEAVAALPPALPPTMTQRLNQWKDAPDSRPASGPGGRPPLSSFGR
jgi:spore germination cell wall hydrolase CwlJ-like protein